ncbi:DNA repair exonuclease [Lentilactobacillus curieae]|uniref:DNA repair exonuclease n=1 Tax=Lentilactobacillus curieae TaxID=1138822 RepID=A0A1S6QJW0_9LACO|nr:DNA repair exonuclease [Lentilactobacillus curieae]AQW21927.1 DNA repair exonuclease [Lentilactobacillus curieae]
MKFIHAADVHLDSPFSGLLQKGNLPNTLATAITKSTFSSFKKIVNDAIEESVDFVILAGDLFDRNDRSIAADAFINDQFNQLKDHQIPVYLIFGNHDFFNFDNDHLDYPENVHVFKNDVSTETLTLNDGKTVVLSGFSFKTQWIHDSYADKFPAKSGTDWAIGIMHGSADSVDSPEANYAPFSISQLENKNYDYWALGHIHKRQSLNADKTINYAGNTQGRSINEAGDKGYLLVSEQNGKLIPEFKKTAVIDWKLVTMPVDELKPAELVDRVLAKLADLNLPTTTLVRLVLQSTKPSSVIGDAVKEGDLLEQLQTSNSRVYADINAYIVSVKYQVTETKITSPVDQEFFEQAADSVLKETQVEKYQSLFNDYQFISEDLKTAESQSEIVQMSRQVINEKVNIEQEDR